MDRRQFLTTTSTLFSAFSLPFNTDNFTDKSLVDVDTYYKHYNIKSVSEYLQFCKNKSRIENIYLVTWKAKDVANIFDLLKQWPNYSKYKTEVEELAKCGEFKALTHSYNGSDFNVVMIFESDIAYRKYIAVINKYSLSVPQETRLDWSVQEGYVTVSSNEINPLQLTSYEILFASQKTN